MTAQDNLNPVQFYHGTAHAFSPGDVIDPAQPHKKNWPDADRRAVYFTSDRAAAQIFANKAAGDVDAREPLPGARVYQVAPLGAYGNAYSPTTFKSHEPLRVIK